MRICPDFKEHDISLHDILWAHPYPSLMPSMHDDDITALHYLQIESFAPASTLCMKPENGRVVAIQVYTPLGYYAGITGIRFVYDTGMESMWGSDYDAASLSFFLDSDCVEYIIKVRVYKIDALVCHLQVGISVLLINML